MRVPSDYRNHSPRARAVARLLDMLVAPIAGAPGLEVRRSTSGPPPRRILLIRPDHAGDLLMATPAIRALRRALPQAEIDLLASPWGAPAAAGNPDLDRVLTIEATWFEPGRGEGPEPSELLGSILSIRLGHYDAAADLRGDFRSILLARASGAPRRAGFSRIGLERLLTEQVEFDPGLDHIGRNHAVTRLLGAGPLGERVPVFVVPAPARDRVRKLLEGFPVDCPRIAVFPGTNRPSASWGPERFAKACRILGERRRVAFVLGGREADRSATERVARAIGADRGELISLAGRTTLAEAAALIEACTVLLANDSGASHLCVAVGRPVLSIFGPTDPATLWTWDHPERYVAIAGRTTCERPCFRAGCAGDHGYSAIDPAEVADRIGVLIEQEAG